MASDLIFLANQMEVISFKLLPIRSDRKRRIKRKRRPNDDSDLETEELAHIFQLDAFNPGQLLTVCQRPLDGAPGVLTTDPARCSDESMCWDSFVSCGSTVIGIGYPQDLLDDDLRATVLPSQMASFDGQNEARKGDDNCHAGGAITIRVDQGLLSFEDFIDPDATIAEWLGAHGLAKRELFCQGAKLSLHMKLGNLPTSQIDVSLVPKPPSDEIPAVIRSLEGCKTSGIWSLAEISFWHPNRRPVQDFGGPAISFDYDLEDDPIAMQHRLWLEELVQRLSFATHLMQHWKRRQEALQANSSSKRSKAEMVHQTVQVSPSDSRLVIIRAAASSSGSNGDASHSGGALGLVPPSWFSRSAVHSESDEPSEDSHQLRQKSDSDEVPSVRALASRSLPSSLDSDMGYNPEWIGTSRMVSLSNRMASDLDGLLGYICGIDGVLRPWDLEVELPPSLVLPPQELPSCPPIISLGDVQDAQDDLQSSISSSLAVDLPCSPRSDLGGVIGQFGYAVDLFGVLTAFDMEPPWLDRAPSTPPSQATSQLLESALATFLPEHLPHSGGWITITVDHGLLFLIDTIHLTAATELLALTIAHTGGVVTQPSEEGSLLKPLIDTREDA
eukprot:2801995-Amphidinium_carterae.2